MGEAAACDTGGTYPRPLSPSRKGRGDLEPLSVARCRQVELTEYPLKRKPRQLVATGVEIIWCGAAPVISVGADQGW